MKKLLIVDGNSILNRAYYGIRPLSNKQGLPTNALFGFMTMLKKHLDHIKPDYAVCAFDLKAKTFRHLEYDFYKANRKPMPEDLALQLPHAKELVSLIGFNIVELEGYEADDVIGTVSRLASDEVHAYVLTGDRDSLQLINENTSVILVKTKEDVIYTPEKFTEEYGVTPTQYIDVKAIMGDSSDNIPGIHGIGEKGAFKLIQDFGSLNALYENYAESSLSLGMKSKIENGREMAFASRHLATIVLDAPINKTLNDLTNKGFDKYTLRSRFITFEFGSLIKKFGLEGLSAKENEEVELTRVENTSSELLHSPPSRQGTPWGRPAEEGKGEEPSAQKITSSDVSLDEFAACDPLTVGEQMGFDFGEEKLEPTPVSLPTSVRDGLPNDGELFAVYFNDEGVGICTEDGELYSLGLADALAFLSGKDVICHDIKSLIKKYDINCVFDTMLAGYVISPADSSYELPDLTIRYLNMDFDEKYGAFFVYALYKQMQKHLNKDKTSHILSDIEIPLAKVLASMECEGFKVDLDGLRSYSAYLTELENEYKARIFELAGEEFNVNSPKQLGEILFGKLGLPHGKKTKSGYSTSADILEELAPEYEIVSKVLDYRHVAKLNSTYCQGLSKVADENGIIHTTFNQTVAVTGRLSSTEPNLQNIPVRTKLGKELRKFFITKGNDYVLIDADYSQIELKVLAHMSRDANMIYAFNSGLDIHTSTAALVFGLEPSEVTPELRKRAKAVNFGIVYGIGDFSLGKDLGISKKEAKAYIDSYFATYPDIHAFIRRLITEARETGYAKTLFGRVRYIPELSAKNKMVQSFGERAAMNSPIQGTAADIIKIAMINTHRALKKSGIDARLILQVHDELIIEAHKDCHERALEILRKEMENAISLSVPLTAEISIGSNWLDAK